MLRRLGSDRRGVAMVEFAFTLPVLLTMFLGSFVISDMISCSRKVTASTRALTDMVSRNVSPASSTTTGTLTTYLTAAQLVMTPYNASNSTLQIAELRVCDATHAYVVWAQRQTDSTTVTATLTAGAVTTLPTGLVTTPMIPTSPDGSNVCNNTTSGPNKVQVGTAGGYLFYGTVDYAYRPAIGYGAATTTNMSDAIYMIPRLN